MSSGVGGSGLLILGEVTCKERSDEAGQFVGKWVGNAAAAQSEEPCDERCAAKARRVNRYSSADTINEQS
jgi:hypothetical protein